MSELRHDRGQGVQEEVTYDRRAERARKPRSRRRYWLTSAGRLVAGMKYLGQWEERVESVIAELGEIHGILCVERLLELVRRGDKFVLKDLGSSNGTFVNGRQIRDHELSSGDQVQLGRTLLLYTGVTDDGLEDLADKVNIVARGTLESVKNGDIYCTVKSGTKGSSFATTSTLIWRLSGSKPSFNAPPVI